MYFYLFYLSVVTILKYFNITTLIIHMDFSYQNPFLSNQNKRKCLQFEFKNILLIGTHFKLNTSKPF